MNPIQVAIGVVLLAVSALTFFKPSAVDSAVISLLVGLALVVGTGAVFQTVARDVAD